MTGRVCFDATDADGVMAWVPAFAGMTDLTHRRMGFARRNPSLSRTE